MREIKFRVFCKDTDEMFADIPLENISYWCDKGDNILDTEGNVIMQYTGLKDVNGKEVYEGDILKYGYVVTYVDGSKGEDLGMSIGFYSQRDGFESWGMLEAGEEIEVIGNIYESEDNQ